MNELINMGLKGLILGGMIGFGIGVYHGYNYAGEQCKKEGLHTKVAYEQIYKQDYRNGLEEMVGSKAVITYKNLVRF
jgi:hypothetical protein